MNMKENPKYVTEGFNTLYKGFQEIKYDLKKYLIEYFKPKKIKVTFTVRDKDVWSNDLPIWRYWIGFDTEIKNKKKNDISQLFINDINNTREDYIPKLKAYWSYKNDEIFEDTTPNVFIKDKDYSGKVSPSKNWAIFHLPKILERENNNSILRFHSNVHRECNDFFPNVIRKFLNKITELNGLKINDTYIHQKLKTKRREKAENLYKLAFSIMKNEANEKFDILEKNVKEFFIRGDLGSEYQMDDLIWDREFEYIDRNDKIKQQAYFRFLNRAIDYYSIFSGYSHIISYGLVIAGYHLLTFYIFISLEEEEISINEVFPGWKSLELIGTQFGLYNKLFEKFDGNYSKFFEFLGSIDSIIKSGWTNAVNSVLAELATEGANKGFELEKMLEEALSVMLMMKNPNKDQLVEGEIFNEEVKLENECPFGNECKDDEIKFQIFERYSPKGNYEKQNCQNRGMEPKVPCENLEICLNENEPENKRQYVLIRLRKNEFSDPVSSLIIIEGMIKSFIRYYNDIVIPKRNEMTKSAISAIMSRNMSHNIGSHVLARLSTKADFSANAENEIKRTLLQIACLNSYLRTRMDFLADVSTSIPFITTPKYFYSDVLRYFRPFESDTPDDEKEHRWPQLLIDRISGGVKIGSDNNTLLDSSKISLKVKVQFDNIELQDVKPNSTLDPIISFPNDVLGAHALYTILENIIRNCAKHSKIQKELSLLLKIKTTNKWRNRFYLLEVSDNLGEYNLSRKDKDQKGKNKLLIKLESYVNTSILDSQTGKLRKGGWGILEMKIAAAYLRRIPPEYIDAKISNLKSEPEVQLKRNGKNIKEPPILQPFLDDKNNIGYRIYLEKPQIAIIVSDDGKAILKESNVKDFERLGVKEVSYQEVDLKKGTEHEFLLLINPTEKQVNEARLSNQQYVVVSINSIDKTINKIKTAFSTNDARTIRHQLWNLKVTNLWGKVSLFQANDFSNISRWIDNQGSNIIFYDNHGNCIKKEQENKGYNSYDYNSMFYYEPYSTYGPTGLLIERVKSLLILEENQGSSLELKYKFEKEIFFFELLDAAAARCLIVDERIQDKSQKNDLQIDTKQSGDILERMKICIPSKDKIDLDKQEFNGADKKVINKWIFEFLSKIDTRFLIIHLGIIEKITGTDKNAISNWLKKYEQQIKSQDKSIIVISGRGTPSNLPENCLFLPYSMVDRYVFEFRSKYHLCKVLFSARRK